MYKNIKASYGVPEKQQYNAIAQGRNSEVKPVIMVIVTESILDYFVPMS